MSTDTSEQSQAKKLGLDVASLRNSGDISGAADAYQSVLDSGQTSVLTAPSVLAGSHLPYLLNPTTSTALKSVAELKKIAADTSVRPFLRAQALTQIALWPNLSAYNQDVFSNIFNDPAYKQFLITTTHGVDYQYSVRNLLKYSYSTYPTYRTAIEIADNYILSLYQNEQLHFGDGNKDLLVSGAQEYLAHADDIAVSKSYEQPVSTSVKQDYLAVRAFTMGGLAHFKGKPYTSTYKSTYDDLIKGLTEANTPEANAYLSFSRFLYAHFLIQIDGNTKAAQEQLLQAIALAKADKNFESNPLVRHIRKEKFGNAPYQAPARIDTLTAISPEFKAFVDSIK